jgi:hypothetical protein
MPRDDYRLLGLSFVITILHIYISKFFYIDFNPRNNGSINPVTRGCMSWNYVTMAFSKYTNARTISRKIVSGALSSLDSNHPIQQHFRAYFYYFIVINMNHSQSINSRCSKHDFSFVMQCTRVSIPPALCYSPSLAVLLHELLEGSISFRIALIHSPVLFPDYPSIFVITFKSIVSHRLSPSFLCSTIHLSA